MLIMSSKAVLMLYISNVKQYVLIFFVNILYLYLFID